MLAAANFLTLLGAVFIAFSLFDYWNGGWK